MVRTPAPRSIRRQPAACPTAVRWRGPWSALWPCAVAAVLALGACSSYSIDPGAGGLAPDVAPAQFTSDAATGDAAKADVAEADVAAGCNVAAGPWDPVTCPEPDPTAGADGGAADQTGAAPDADLADTDDGGDGDDGDAAEAVSTCELGACQQDADCSGDLVQAVCQVAVCEAGCCQLATAPDGSLCADADLCTEPDNCQAGTCVSGPAKACDDGQACTLDSCDAATGACDHGLQAGYCLIDGACHEDAALDPTAPCNWCNVVESTAKWSLKPGCCTADGQCPAPGPCDVGTCDVSTGKCSIGKKLGCCAGDVDCDDGNPCTIDACDVATGTCDIQPKLCPAPSSCQKGTCNGATGECDAVLKNGHCFIDGACRVDGESSPQNGCLVCTPNLNDTGWSSNAGAFCNDGDDCTFGDVCDPQGQCQGTPQEGCCKSDADCPPPPDACKAAKCNPAVGLCTTVAKSGCCLAGTCCDPGSNSVQPAGTPCSDSVLATEYQCSGKDVQKRETKPGCDGQGADGCTSNPAFTSVGAWSTIQTCPSGTTCKASGSGQTPTCAPTGPIGSCANSCGGKSQSSGSTCYCDAACVQAGDCCTDFVPTCGCESGECCDAASKYPKAKGTTCGSATYKTEYQCSANTIQKRTAQQTCPGTAGGQCSTSAGDLKWSAWTDVQTCSGGSTCTVAAGGGSATCKASSSGTCIGMCGGKSASACWCDSACTSLGDCCADFAAAGCAGVTTCGSVGTKTCKGKCGGQGTGGCWCDAACNGFGDCCPDKNVCACTP